MSNHESSQIIPEMGTGNADWHRADVIAALKKRGMNITSLSRDSGLAAGTLANALRAPWPKGEKIIAGALGLEPKDIWPSRYQNLQQAS
ncbi:helix-turn-helix transcriptional regulator [Aeromonas caviae]|uniref:Helix-turn-helix domain-containing protein n=1 Tax=Aeromonas bestiarum TaxID=105751 RepID=A0ABT7Q1G4_9GAMM|nr:MULTISPECIES: helix-turn-helix transcriptional regulator [Aeromonas]MDM5073177.1 helix-turn-helix domain-containing protein [Aeromonas bestiarum]MDX7814418.1 helix-turn-helix transcriptional regulator [Aeromonas caviae]